jgi:hypothetical protein
MNIPPVLISIKNNKILIPIMLHSNLIPKNSKEHFPLEKIINIPELSINYLKELNNLE